jgi:hypothetical protein
MWIFPYLLQKTHFYSKTNQLHQFLDFVLFCSSTLHVSDCLFVHRQESKTVHAASSGACQIDSADYLLAGTRCSIPFPLASSQQNLFDIHLMLYVQSQTPDDGRKDSPKHVECYYKIKQNWETGAILWFYYRDITRCTALRTSYYNGHIISKRLTSHTFIRNILNLSFNFLSQYSLKDYKWISKTLHY